MVGHKEFGIVEKWWTSEKTLDRTDKIPKKCWGEKAKQLKVKGKEREFLIMKETKKRSLFLKKKGQKFE